MSFGEVWITLHSCIRFARIPSKMHHSLFLLIPFASAINKCTIPFIFSSLDSRNYPAKLASQLRIQLLRILFSSLFQSIFSINSPSLIFPEPNHIITLKNRALYCSIEVQFQSSATQLQ